MKIDLHVHTTYSTDSSTTLKQVVHSAKKKGLDGVAVTDHDTITGALRLLRQESFSIIPGIEVSSLHGHILGLNVTQPIEPKLGIAETVERIHHLGGIAIIAHPSVVLKTGLGVGVSSASKLDAVETINASAFPFILSMYLSTILAGRLKLPRTAGSDAHHPDEIGNAYTQIEASNNRDDVVEAIKKGRAIPFGRPISWAHRVYRGTYNAQRILTGRR